MVSVGEKSGMLDEVLRTIADYYEADTRIKKKVKSALTYPVVLMALMVGVLVLMVAFVIPAFQKSLSALEVEMPPITTAIMAFSNVVRAYWKEMLLVIVVIVVGIALFIRTKRGKYLWHTLFLKLPIFGKVQNSLISARFARSFGLLLESGMDLTDAMESVIRCWGTKTRKNGLWRWRRGQAGTNFRTLLKVQDVPQMLIQMISVGKDRLNRSGASSCNYFDEQVETSFPPYPR